MSVNAALLRTAFSLHAATPKFPLYFCFSKPLSLKKIHATIDKEFLLSSKSSEDAVAISVCGK